MNNSLMQKLRGANPLPDGIEPLSIEEVWTQLEAEDKRAGGSLTSGRDSVRRPGPMTGILVPAAAVVVTFVIAGGAFLLLARGGANRREAPAVAAPTLRGADLPLIRLIGALRRPQRPSDRDPGLLRTLEQQRRDPALRHLIGVPVLSLIRRATTTPWGQTIYLVPERMRPQRSTGRQAAGAGGGHVGPGLTLTTYPTGSSGATVAQIKAGLDWATGTSGQLILVVPDGVAKVKVWPPSTKSVKSPRPLTAVVRNNVAALQAPETLDNPRKILWLSSSGQVIKRITGNSCNRHLSGC